MKLKEGFVFQQVGNEYMAVTSGDLLNTFNGMFKLNESGYQIVEFLNNDQQVSIHDICEYMHGLYPDSDMDTIEYDIRKITDALQQYNLLELPA